MNELIPQILNTQNSHAEKIGRVQQAQEELGQRIASLRDDIHRMEQRLADSFSKHEQVTLMSFSGLEKDMRALVGKLDSRLDALDVSTTQKLADALHAKPPGPSRLQVAQQWTIQNWPWLSIVTALLALVLYLLGYRDEAQAVSRAGVSLGG